METEQAEEQIVDAGQGTVEVAPEKPQGTLDILTDALKANQSTPEVETEAGQKPKEEQAPIEEPPFLELLLDEKNKLPIKSEDEFIAFLERNPTLKDGWLRQSDYTRKTQELSQSREQFERLKKEEEAFWGEVKPDKTSLQSLKTVWDVFQSSEPIVQDAIQKFVEDVSLIAKGEIPVGPLSQIVGGGQSQVSQDLLPLKNHIAKLENELRQFRGQTEAEKREVIERQKAEMAQRAESQIDSWIETKEKSGVKISPNELRAMSDFMSILDEKGQPKMSLDQAYELSQAMLGKTKAAVAKEILQSSKTLSSKTPKAPSSKGSSLAEPEAKTVLGILQQGAKSLS